MAKVTIQSVLLLVMSGSALFVSFGLLRRLASPERTPRFEKWTPLHLDAAALVSPRPGSRDTVILFVDVADPASRQLLRADAVGMMATATTYQYYLPNDRTHRASTLSLVAECEKNTRSVVQFAVLVDSLLNVSQGAFDDWFAAQLKEPRLKDCLGNPNVQRLIARGWLVADEAGVTSAPAVVVNHRLDRNPRLGQVASPVRVNP